MAAPEPNDFDGRKPVDPEILEIVRESWLEVLPGIQQISLSDDFFDLGGRSLLASRMVARLRQRLGIRVRAVTLLSNRTLEDFARVVDELKADERQES